MKKKIAFLSLLIVFLLGCKSQNAPEEHVQSLPQKEEKKSFFPVTSFLKGQLVLLDSIPVNPLYITTIKGKIDSAWIKKEALRPILHPFLHPEIDSLNFIQYFKESSFNDQTANAITLTYEPIGKLPDTIELRTWNVYINPKSGKVTGIYMNKEFKENNLIITQQLFWETDNSAKINTIINHSDGSSELLKEQKIIWDF